MKRYWKLTSMFPTWENSRGPVYSSWPEMFDAVRKMLPSSPIFGEFRRYVILEAKGEVYLDEKGDLKVEWYKEGREDGSE